MNKKLYDELTVCSHGASHFFHVLSHVRPLVWIMLYVALVPVFAVIYSLLPAGQFRIPEGAGTEFGSWIYYSIVTITTLGFGDYTPAHGWAQTFTAIEVGCGLIIMGLFLNSVGSMKSEIDVTNEVEKQRRAHYELEKDKLANSLPLLLHNLQKFLKYCYAVTTPLAKRKKSDGVYDPDFKIQDMADMFRPSGLDIDKTRIPAVDRLLKKAAQTSLSLDSLQTRVDMTLWPDLLEDCFSFVADFQMFSSAEDLSDHPDSLLSEIERRKDGETEEKLSRKIAEWSGPIDTSVDNPLRPVAELYYFIKGTAAAAIKLEKAFKDALTKAD